MEATLHHEEAPHNGDNASWNMLRAAIAEDLIQKLPRYVSLATLSSSLGVPAQDVSTAITEGTLVVRRRGNARYMDTVRSKAFLAQATSIRLPLPRSRRSLFSSTVITMPLRLTKDVADALAEAGAKAGKTREDMAACYITDAIGRSNGSSESSL